MATIEIVDLRVSTIIGTKSWERKKRQEVIINISLDYDASKASHSDKLSDTLDYDHIAKTVIKTVEDSKCFLLEKLGDRIMAKLKGYKGLKEASLRIDKPKAVSQARCISYKINTK